MTDYVDTNYTWHQLKEKFTCYVTLPWPKHIIIKDGKEYMSADPNERWRPYLESEFGVQNVDWAWDVSYHVDNSIDIFFNSETEAMLFKLTWI